MATQTIDLMIEGGKASGGPPLGPALGPLQIPVNQVVSKINEKTQAMAGMSVPVKVIVDIDKKTFEITVGMPPTSALLRKEAKVEKGSGSPKLDKIADLRIEQIIKIALTKDQALFGRSLKEQVKQVIGTCNSMGLLVEGVSGEQAIKLVDQGKFDAKIQAKKTELTAEELHELELEKKRLEDEKKKRLEDEKKKAQLLMDTELKGKTAEEARRRLEKEGISSSILDEMFGVKAAKQAPGAAPQAAAATKK